MSIPAHVRRFWQRMDGLLGRVESTPWGAIVTDGRFPAIWDTNYARIDAPAKEPALDDVAARLLPALSDAGATTFHVVTFDPEGSTGLLTALSRLGHRMTMDLVMDLDLRGAAGSFDEVARRSAERAGGATVEELPPDDRLWSAVESSLALFGIENPEAVAQLRRLEAEVMAPGGKRWFGIRRDDRVVALAALLVLEGIGYVDNVVTFPEARSQGLATAITATLVARAADAGAEHACLFADPDEAKIVALYERLGFRAAGMLPSTRGPVAGIDRSAPPRRSRRP